MMPSAAHREKKTVLTGQIDAINDVGLARAPDDETGSTIDRQILDHPKFLVAGVTRRIDRTAEQHAESGDLFVVEDPEPLGPWASLVAV